MSIAFFIKAVLKGECYFECFTRQDSDQPMAPFSCACVYLLTMKPPDLILKPFWRPKGFIVTLYQIAVQNRFHVSYYHLSRRFQDITGYGFQQYLTICRLNEAKRLLLMTDIPITLVAENSGWGTDHVGALETDSELLFKDAMVYIGEIENR